MPLGEGNTWEYVVRLDGDETTQTVKTVRRAPVGDADGWLLESQMGSFRLGWDGDVLLAAELPDSSYSPPIPLLAPQRTEWSGTVSTPTGRSAATAKLVRTNERLDVGGRQYQTIKTVLTLDSDGEKVQLTTWFFPGMGILRQEQRRGPGLTRDRFVEFVEGP
jgi:hypothetical protein